MRKLFNRWSAKHSYLAAGIVMYLLFLLGLMSRSYPQVGEDYRYFLTHMLDTYIHYQQNGLSIQWFTPSFGGGLPAYPNPQHIQFTLNQGLVFLLDPWWSNFVSILLYTTAGYFACYRLGTDILKLGWKAAVLGALFFTTTGFHIQHNLVGHVGYQVFSLIPFAAYLIFSSRWPVWQRGLLLGLIAAMFIHIAGFYTLIIMGLSLSMLLPLVYLLHAGWFNLKQLILVGGVGGLTTGLLSIGKIYAVARFMMYFPREIQDHYYATFRESLSAILLQWTGVPFLAIPYRLVTKDPAAIERLMNNLVAGGKYGIWEKDVSLSPVLVFILVFALRKLPGKILQAVKTRGSAPTPRLDQVLAVIVLCLGIWASFEMTSARGMLFDLSRGLPFFGSLHVNIRFASSFVLPFAVLGAYLVEQEFSGLAQGRRFQSFSVLYLLTLLWLGVYFLLPNTLETSSYDLRETIREYQSARQGKANYVTEVMDVPDVEVFSNHATSLYPHEPIFGYSLEKFKTRLVPGSIYTVTQGFYNLYHPNNFVYGSDGPFTRFSVGEEDIMEQFVHYQQPDWEIPAKQLTYNVISAVTFFGIAGYGIVFLMTKRFGLRTRLRE